MTALTSMPYSSRACARLTANEQAWTLNPELKSRAKTLTHAALPGRAQDGQQVRWRPGGRWRQSALYTEVINLCNYNSPTPRSPGVRRMDSRWAVETGR